MSRISEAASQRVQEAMRTAIKHYEVLRAHIEGDQKRRIPACAQCLEVDMHPRRVRARCEAGRDIRTAAFNAVASASTLISRARIAAGRSPLIMRGRFNLEEHIRHFYELEFTGTLAPPVPAPGRTMLPTEIKISAEQMGEFKKQHGGKKAQPKSPEPGVATPKRHRREPG